jgi:hypothetical protein
VFWAIKKALFLGLHRGLYINLASKDYGANCSLYSKLAV